MFPDKFKKNMVEMKPNLAYETVSLPHPSKPATQVHTKPCPAYEVTVQAHHWGLNVVLYAVKYMTWWIDLFAHALTVMQ